MMFNNFPTSTNTKTQNFLEGVKLILKYQPDADIMLTFNDCICLGKYNPEQMTEEELILMDLYGWYGNNSFWEIWM